MPSTPTVSVIIPALNAAATLPGTLAALVEAGEALEVLVVDGGSEDETAHLAPRLITAPRGRGRQLKAGAEAATGAWMLFLHADTRLSPGWWREAQAHMAEHPSQAAAFTLRFDDDDPRARRVERLAAWRARRLGLPYGDQGLLLSRDLYESVGGFKPLPLMEDVDLVRRLGRRRLRLLSTAAVTSADRYRRDGWFLRPVRNVLCLTLWRLGVPPERLVGFYGGRRSRS